MFNFYKPAEKYINRKLNKAGLVNKQISSANFQIDYWDCGSDKACIFLLNGFGAKTEFQWFKQIEVLQKNYRIILINLLYFGHSKPVNDTCHNIECQVEFIEALRNSLQIEKFTIAGISYGGLVAAEYTHANSSKVEKLILIDAAVKFLTIEHLEIVCKNYGVQSIENFFAPKDAYTLKKQLQAAYYSHPFMPSMILKSIHKEMCIPYLNNWLELIKSLRASIDSLSTRSYDFETPTLIFWGEEDEIIPLSLGEKIKNEIKHSKLIRIPKAGHMPNLEKSRTFNRLLQEHLINSIT